MRYKIVHLYKADNGSGKYSNFLPYVFEVNGKSLYIQDRANAVYIGFYTQPATSIIIGNTPPWNDYFMGIPETHLLFNYDKAINSIKRHRPEAQIDTVELSEVIKRYYKELERIFTGVYEEMQTNKS